MEKFKLVTVSHVYPRDGHVVRAILTDEVYNELKRVANETDYPVSQLTSKAIEYALQNLEVVEM